MRRLAIESELSVRTLDVVLAALKDFGYIKEQRKPGPHRPRTWSLNLDMLKTSGSEFNLDPQASAHLAPLPGRQDRHSDTQNCMREAHITAPDRQAVADDPVIDPAIDPVREPQHGSASAPPCTLVNDDKEYRAHYSDLLACAQELVVAHPDISYDELVASLREAHPGCIEAAVLRAAVVARHRALVPSSYTVPSTDGLPA